MQIKMSAPNGVTPVCTQSCAERVLSLLQAVLQVQQLCNSWQLCLYSYVKVKNVVDDILEKLPEEFNMVEIMQKSAERSPYILVCFQECERMNILIQEIRRSLKQLDLGLKVRKQFIMKVGLSKEPL